MTDAEQKLWQCQRGGQLDGLKFGRQHPVPPYTADFCCVGEKLIVELDGSQHNEQVDEARTRHLEAQGWRILRSWDHDVLQTTEAVLEAICNGIGKPNPHPNPSADWRGAPSGAVP
jgi:very-short-patch-repair endonuclease